MKNKLYVNQIIPFANVDGDGNRCSIFLQGCNLNCVYCHNSETINRCNQCGKCVKSCPTGALQLKNGQVIYEDSKCCKCDECIRECPYNSTPKAKWMDVEEIYEQIVELSPYIRGITVSGGEATLQYEGVLALFQKVKPLGLTCYIDTNGHFDIKAIADLIKETDGFLFDIKGAGNIEKLCDEKNYSGLSNLVELLKKEKIVEVRTVILNEYMDIDATIQAVQSVLSGYNIPYRLINAHLIGLKESQKLVLKENILSTSTFNRYKKKLI